MKDDPLYVYHICFCLSFASDSKEALCQVTNWWVAKQYVLFMTILSLHMRCFRMKSICKSIRLQISTRFSLIWNSISDLEINSFLQSWENVGEFPCCFALERRKQGSLFRKRNIQEKNKAFYQMTKVWENDVSISRLLKTYIHSSAL